MKAVLTLMILASALFGVMESGFGPAPGIELVAETKRAEGQDPVFARKDVPYVPTGYASVDAMLRLAKVTSEDVVYDLGSGDGRIVIAAARDYGARGVGIDIDPALVEEARENAENEGVSDRVAFIEGDLFEADLREATVVTLYLLPEVNRRLRPKLFRELRPGTPVVSHAFMMGEWAPDEFQEVEDDRLYLWIMPADVKGTWRWKDLEADHIATLTQEFQMVKGTIRVGRGGGRIRDGRVEGTVLRFEIGRTDAEGRAMIERYSGQILGDRIEGTITVDGNHRPWIATRR